MSEKGIQSTKIKPHQMPTGKNIPFADDVDFLEFLYAKSFNKIYSKIIATSDIVSADLSRKLKIASVRGHQYILFFIWNKYIHYEPIVDRSAKSYLLAYESAINFFRSKNCLLDFCRLDNETSVPLEAYIKENVRSFEYVPPGNHRANMAEITVRDGKIHFVAILGGIHPSFPITQWDLLIPHSELKLNLLRPFGPDNTKSAHTGIHGAPYDFKAHPLAPSESLCVGFTPSDARHSWDPHGYLGTSLNYYRCQRLFVIATKNVRVTDTVDFPRLHLMPGSSSVEQQHALITDTEKTLQSIANTNIDPIQKTLFHDTSQSAVKHLKDLLLMFKPEPIVNPVAISPHSPASVKYKDSINLILNNLQALAVNIYYYRLTPGSYQFEDYTLWICAL